MLQTSKEDLGQMHKARVLRPCCITPLQLRGIRSAVSHGPSRHAHACKRSPSVRLLRRFQFCKSGPISLRGLDRFTFGEKRKMGRRHFHSMIKPAQQAFIRRSLQGYRHAGLPTSCYCGLCECFAGGTAVLGFKDANIRLMFDNSTRRHVSVTACSCENPPSKTWP
jgi:hypothetical protein